MNDLRAERAIPDTAWAIIEATAAEYDRDRPEDLLQVAPRDRELSAARAAAITRVANEMIDERPRYPIAKVQAWFNVSRAAINRQRVRSREYVSRVQRR